MSSNESLSVTDSVMDSGGGGQELAASSGGGRRNGREPATRFSRIPSSRFKSMMATSKLHKNGYKNLGWLAGGFNRAVDGDFPEVEGPEKLQYATIGGASYYFLKILILLQAVGKNK